MAGSKQLALTFLTAGEPPATQPRSDEEDRASPLMFRELCVLCSESSESSEGLESLESF